MRTEQITTTPFPNSNSNDACISKNVNDVESAIRHNEIMIHPNSNSNDACISKNVNDVESAIRHNEIMIHPNSNFCNITGGKIIPINEESEINGISKENISRFLIEYKSLRAPSRK